MSLKKQLGDWYPLLEPELSKPYMKQLSLQLKDIRSKIDVYPKPEEVFRAFELCPLSSLKIIILAQDPYHTKDAATGLAFSVNETFNPIPPSLRNIFKEIESDIGFQPYHNPDLSRWAKQGVLLLNTALTVQHGLPNSHSQLWKPFTDRVIELIIEQNKPVLFLLFGKFAQQVLPMIKPPHGFIVTAHPSPFSAFRGFFETRPFSRANNWLIQNNYKPIDWL